MTLLHWAAICLAAALFLALVDVILTRKRARDTEAATRARLYNVSRFVADANRELEDALQKAEEAGRFAAKARAALNSASVAADGSTPAWMTKFMHPQHGEQTVKPYGAVTGEK